MARWVYNLAPSASSMGHGFWTDNRDVRPPLNGNWENYTPVTSEALGVQSRFDPTQVVPPCLAGQTGMRNQNIYTARVTEGLFLGAPGNTKPLGTIQRAFVVTAENATLLTRSYRFTILNQPTGGQASFLQFTAPGAAPLTVLDVTIPPQSTVARSVFATATVETARIEVSVAEIAVPGAGAPLPGGQTGTIVLNGDPTAPRIQNPRIQNPRIQNPVQLAEEYNPTITTAFLANPAQAPRIQNPRIQNPIPEAPRIQNDTTQAPRIQNDGIANVDIVNPRIQNPTPDAAVVEAPSMQNPRIQNTDLTNAGINDTTWVLTNDGNTTASYTINLVTNAPLPTGFASQLLVHKTTTTPTAQNCLLAEQPYAILVANIPDPEFVPVTELGNPRIQNPRIQNSTISLAPGESANVTLRVVDPNRLDGVTFDGGAAVAPAAVAQAVNTVDAANGITQPPVAVPLTITTAGLVAAAPGAAYSFTLQNFGAAGQTTWIVTNGVLPPGLTLDPATGLISGTPTSPGNYVFTVQSTDTNGSSDTQTLTIQINPNTPAGFDRVWNGVDADWSNPLNWSPNGVPVSTDSVYISAATTPSPMLTRDVSIQGLVLEDGATLNTNGFVLTVAGQVWAGNTIVGSGQTVVTGNGASVSGTFSNLTIAGSASLAGPLNVTGTLTLLPGVQLNLNGQSVNAQSLNTDATSGPRPSIIGAGRAFLAASVNVNGLVLDRVAFTIGGGTMTRFDNVAFMGYTPADVQLTVNHPGTAAPLVFNGLSFFTTPTTGRYLQATDTLNDAQILIINLVNGATADGSALTSTTGGAVVNWIATPGTANLAVSQTASPNPAVAGSPLTYSIAVRNGGPAVATGVTLTWTPPAGAAVTSAISPQGSCTIGATVACGLGSLAAEASALVTIVVTPGAAPTATAVAVASSGVTDPVPANNTNAFTTQVVAAGSVADLSIVKHDSADPVTVNTPFAYTLTVTNAGPAAAADTFVIDTIPAGLVVNSATTPQGACTVAASQVHCGLGTIAAGQTAVITITVTATTAGPVSNVATAWSSAPDSNAANNVAVESTMIGLTVACSGSLGGPTMLPVGAGPALDLLTGDLNQDGNPDLVTTVPQANSVAVFLGNGSGGFTGPTMFPAGTGALEGVLADFNGDQIPDLALEGLNDAFVLLGTGSGGFAPPSTFSYTPEIVSEVRAADFNGDGNQDLVIAAVGASTTTMRILLGNGAGAFAAPTSFTLPSRTPRFVIDDYDRDGDQDIAVGYVAPVSGQLVDDVVTILFGDGQGGFPTSRDIPINQTSSQSFVFTLGDLNSDGFADLGLVEFGTVRRLVLLFGDGTGNFTPQVLPNGSPTIFRVASGDINGDGWLDLVSSDVNQVGIHLGDGAGGFAAPVLYAVPTPDMVLAADFNLDGRLDVAAASRAGTGAVAILLNRCGQPETNLSLVATDAPDPVAEGDLITYSLTVTNSSQVPATGVIVDGREG